MSPAAEIPLIIFTLLIQLAVGILLVGIAASGFKPGPARERLFSQSWFALIFVAIGALLSMIHLGNPLHSPFTLLHAGSSWLSREILMVLLAGAALLGVAWSRWKKPDSRLADALITIAAFLGLVLIYTMSKVYDSPFLPGWEGSSTFFLFLASALILGGLWCACALSFGKAAEIENRKAALWRVFFMAAAGFVLLAIFAPLSLPDGAAALNQAGSAYSGETVAFWQGMHALLSGLGILLFACAIWRGASGGTAAGLTMAALMFGICGEIAGRSAFYMSYARLGM